jgi:hypothetical protein
LRAPHRQPLDGSAKIEPVHQLRIEARNGEARNGVDDDSPDVLKLDAGRVGGASCHLLEQGQCMQQEDVRPRFPAMLLLVPLRRLASIAGFYPSVAEEVLMPRELREKPLGAERRVLLRQAVRRHRRGHARDLHLEARRCTTGRPNLAGRFQ